MRDIVKILMFGGQLRRHARGSIEILQDVQAIITAENPYVPPAEGQPPV
jgi:hypothetical protein